MPQFAKVNCLYGAPMGRPDYCDTPDARVQLFRVNLSGGGCYDDGGVYWGFGDWKSQLYCARDKDKTVQVFTRAPGRAAAWQNIQEMYPQLQLLRRTPAQTA
jgi:hypothetical protein